MTPYIALLRGINVGKNRRIAMADLRSIVEGIGFTNVKTLLNSGNVVFTAPNGDTNPELAASIEKAITKALNMDVPVIVRSGAEMQQVVKDNPFPDRVGEPKTLHVTFLSKLPDPEKVAALAGFDKGDDDYRVTGDNAYLSYPNKITGAVFMPNGLDKALGVASTSRNWATVTKLAGMSST